MVDSSDRGDRPTGVDGDARPGVIERAFELAHSGQFSTVKDIERQLSRENYLSVRQHLIGRMTRERLRKACLASKVPSDCETEEL